MSKQPSIKMLIVEDNGNTIEELPVPVIKYLGGYYYIAADVIYWNGMGQNAFGSAPCCTPSRNPITLGYPSDFHLNNVVEGYGRQTRLREMNEGINVTEEFKKVEEAAPLLQE